VEGLSGKKKKPAELKQGTLSKYNTKKRSRRKRVPEASFQPPDPKKHNARQQLTLKAMKSKKNRPAKKPKPSQKNSETKDSKTANKPEQDTKQRSNCKKSTPIEKTFTQSSFPKDKSRRDQNSLNLGSVSPTDLCLIKDFTPFKNKIDLTQTYSKDSLDDVSEAKSIPTVSYKDVNAEKKSRKHPLFGHEMSEGFSFHLGDGSQRHEEPAPDATLPFNHDTTKESLFEKKQYLSDDGFGDRQNPIAIDSSPETTSRIRSRIHVEKQKSKPSQRKSIVRSKTPEKDDVSNTLEEQRALSPKKRNTLSRKLQSPKPVEALQKEQSPPRSQHLQTPTYQNRLTSGYTPSIHTEQELSFQENFERNKDALFSAVCGTPPTEKSPGYSQGFNFDESPVSDPATPKKVQLARKKSALFSREPKDMLQDSFDLFALNNSEGLASQPGSQKHRKEDVLNSSPVCVSSANHTPTRSQRNSPAKSKGYSPLFDSYPEPTAPLFSVRPSQNASQEPPLSYDPNVPPLLEMSTQDQLAKDMNPDIVEEKSPSPVNSQLVKPGSKDLDLSDEHIDGLSLAELRAYTKRLRDIFKKQKSPDEINDSSLEIVGVKNSVVKKSMLEDKSLEIIEGKSRIRAVPEIDRRRKVLNAIKEKKKKGSQFAFIDSSRSAADRAQMTGVSCEECGKFFAALGKENLNMEVCDCIDEVSRHRYRHKKPTSPDHFWRTDMPATPDTQSLDFSTLIE